MQTEQPGGAQARRARQRRGGGPAQFSRARNSRRCVDRSNTPRTCERRRPGKAGCPLAGGLGVRRVSSERSTSSGVVLMTVGCIVRRGCCFTARAASAVHGPFLAGHCPGQVPQRCHYLCVSQRPSAAAARPGDLQGGRVRPPPQICQLRASVPASQKGTTPAHCAFDAQAKPQTICSGATIAVRCLTAGFHCCCACTPEGVCAARSPPRRTAELRWAPHGPQQGALARPVIGGLNGAALMDHSASSTTQTATSSWSAGLHHFAHRSPAPHLCTKQPPARYIWIRRHEGQPSKHTLQRNGTRSHSRACTIQQWYRGRAFSSSGRRAVLNNACTVRTCTQAGAGLRTVLIQTSGQSPCHAPAPAAPYLGARAPAAAGNRLQGAVSRRHSSGVVDWAGVHLAGGVAAANFQAAGSTAPQLGRCQLAAARRKLTASLLVA